MCLGDGRLEWVCSVRRAGARWLGHGVASIVSAVRVPSTPTTLVQVHSPPWAAQQEELLVRDSPVDAVWGQVIHPPAPGVVTRTPPERGSTGSSAAASCSARAGAMPCLWASRCDSAVFVASDPLLPALHRPARWYSAAMQAETCARPSPPPTRVAAWGRSRITAYRHHQPPTTAQHIHPQR